eukprot:136211-Pyramimonas_sp.AAC.1
MTGLEKNVYDHVQRVEKVFGKCKLNKHSYTNCAVRYTKSERGDGAAADAKATALITDMFVSLRGALAYALLTQVWLMAHVVSLQKIQEPTTYKSDD